MYEGAKVFGVMDYRNFRQMTIDIAAGRYKPSESEPQKWFATFAGLAKYAKEQAERQEKMSMVSE